MAPGGSRNQNLLLGKQEDVKKQSQRDILDMMKVKHETSYVKR
jgi:hypothetical protein